MITQTAEIDEAIRPSGLDTALESSTSLPGQQPSLPLRVFISYKEKDRTATLDIKKVLLKVGGGNIRVFVSGDEPAGIQWREGVLNELRNAHILIFLYTDPEARWARVGGDRPRRPSLATVRTGSDPRNILIERIE